MQRCKGRLGMSTLRGVNIRGTTCLQQWVGMWCAEEHDEWFGTSDLASHPRSVG